MSHHALTLVTVKMTFTKITDLAPVTFAIIGKSCLQKITDPYQQTGVRA